MFKAFFISSLFPQANRKIFFYLCFEFYFDNLKFISSKLGKNTYCLITNKLLSCGSTKYSYIAFLRNKYGERFVKTMLAVIIKSRINKHNMKKTFIISYDLNDAKPEDYGNIYEVIKEYGTWAHITESTWAIVTTEKAKEVRDKLIKIMPDGSSLFVIKSGNVAAWRNVQCSNDWLKKHL